MAKKKKDTEIIEESEPGIVPVAAKQNIDPEKSMTKEERKKYRKAVRALRRSEWLDEYWIIVILSLVVLALMITLTIGKAIQDKRQEEEDRREQEGLDTLDETDIYNIREEMERIF